ncbi:MAG: hypothetical protein ACOC3V_01425 [bacterium]
MLFENINKSNISFDDYIKLKTKTLTKSYTEKFKWVNRFLLSFSWFGNAVSIFLAFFFIQYLFLSSFIGIKDSVFITIGIIFFLSLFELLKRYVFGLFSSEFIKSEYSILRYNMITFLISVLILISGSFYFSLNGAMKFVDNRQVFIEQTETDLTSKVDSINTFYLNEYIRPLMDENKNLTQQNEEYREEANRTGFITRYTNLIETNNRIIENNRGLISEYEDKRDVTISELKESKTNSLTENLLRNKSNMTAFIIISSIIEIIIMIGVYYNKFYNNKKIEEYENTILSTPQFKNWYKFNQLLELIYSKVDQVGEKIPSTNALYELSELTGNKIDKKTMENFVKTLYYLNILKLEGNRRVLNVNKELGLARLKLHFDIK